LISLVNVWFQDDTENLPFPNDEREFSLPEADFASMMNEKLKQEKPEGDVEPDAEIKHEKKESIKNVKEVSKKENSKDLKENSHKKDSKESKDVTKDRKDKEVTKEPKKISGKDLKDGRRESKEPKPVKSRGSIKEKKEGKKEEEKDESLATYINSIKKERVRELSESKSDDSSPKRGAKRSTRGSIKPDDTSSNKSSSPITTPTPPPSKRRRT
jgi:MRG-binding protein